VPAAAHPVPYRGSQVRSQTLDRYTVDRQGKQPDHHILNHVLCVAVDKAGHEPLGVSEQKSVFGNDCPNYRVLFSLHTYTDVSWWELLQEMHQSKPAKALRGA